MSKVKDSQYLFEKNLDFFSATENTLPRQRVAGQAGRLTASVRRGFYDFAYFLVMTISMFRLRMEIRTLSEMPRITLRSMPSHS